MTLFKPSGRKFFSVEFIDVTGKRVRKSTKRETKKEAQKVAYEIIQNYNDTVSQSDMNLEALLYKVFEDRWKLSKDAPTVIGRVKKISSLYGSLIISEIKPDIGVNLTKALMSEGKSQATCNRYLSVLTTALSDAVNVYQLIDSAPKFRKFKELAKKDRYVSKEEEKTLIDKIEREEFHDLVVVLLDTGIRLSACLNMKRHNIDMEKEVITIYAEEQKGTKVRSIPMTERVKKIISKRLSDEGIFSMTKDASTNYMKKLKKKLPESFQDISLHTLRHTFASRLVQSGVSLYVVQYLLGHSSIKTTERYAHLDTDSVQDAISKLSV